MKGWVDTRPNTDVAAAEYRRLLGYPPGHGPGSKSLALAEQAESWYRQHGRPWVAARPIENLKVTSDGASIQGISFASSRLRRTLRAADAHAVILVAACAGPELEEEAHRLWKRDRPDEYFFLETLGSAVVEHLITMAGARLCAEADDEHMAVLPHYSPGYPDWDISEQNLLLSLMHYGGNGQLPGDLEALPSGMLRPKKSLIAAFGLTRHTDRVRRITDLSPCENCSYVKCQYRRAPYRRELTPNELDVTPRLTRSEFPIPVRGLDPDALYRVSTRALRQWSRDRLRLTEQADGGIEARFQYDGTTCSNLGQPLSFLYQVNLSPRDEGYVIRGQTCAPTPDDRGHTCMCRYRQDGKKLLETIEAEKSLMGRPLNDVIDWSYSGNAAGCYCEPASRTHKWGLVLETLHYALVEQEKQQDQYSGAGRR